jgi:hypothetical protein
MEALRRYRFVIRSCTMISFSPESCIFAQKSHVIRVLCSYFIQPLHGRNLLRMYSWQLIRFQSVGIIAEAAWCDFSERMIFSGCEQSQQLCLTGPCNRSLCGYIQ